MSIKGLIKRTVFPYLVKQPDEEILPKWYDAKQTGSREYSFGPLNPDKKFYVIWRGHLGSGFFSNFTQVISHILYAEKNGLIPVVDYENFPTLYNETTPVNGTKNAWEYYFKPLNDFSLPEVYQSKQVVVCDGWYPKLFPANYREFCLSHFALQEDVQCDLQKYLPRINSRTLGIHFRGKEMNLTPNHRFAPAVRQMTALTDQLLDERDLDNIFLVTEEKDYAEVFQKRYGKRVFMTPAFRCSKVNAYNLRPRPLHRYLLGREILLDTLLLSHCGALAGSHTGPLLHADRMNIASKFTAIIDNGVNCGNYLAAKYCYRIKKLLPANFGGLPGQVSFYEPGIYGCRCQ